jgi:hypothetical protein
LHPFRELLRKAGGKWGLSLFFVAAAALAHAEEPTLLASESAGSALGTAKQLLRYLADGNIEQAARLSNAPRSRYEVLRDFRAMVGDEEFKRLFARYFEPGNRLLAELALGPRRLLVWELGDADHRLAGQYYVEVDGQFLMDDVPSEERSKLRQAREKLKSGSEPDFPAPTNPSGRTD